MIKLASKSSSSGIATCTADSELPDEFLNGSRVLVASVQKLFNGLTKFGLHGYSIDVDTVLMDDAHICADQIREACRIRIPSEEPAYSALKTLFAADLEQQGTGAYAENLKWKTRRNSCLFRIGLGSRERARSRAF